MGVCTLLLFVTFCSSYTTRCVCFTIIHIIIYIQTKLLQCYYREIVNIQTRLRDVQDPGVDNLGPPVSSLEHCVLVRPSETPNRWPQYDRKRFSSASRKVRPTFLITLTLSSS